MHSLSQFTMDYSYPTRHNFDIKDMFLNVSFLKFNIASAAVLDSSSLE